MMQAFVALDPVAHTPSNPVKKVPRIAFNQAITMINQMLYPMLGIKLSRDGTTLGSRYTGLDFRYVVERFRIFSEQGEDLKKPMLIQWNQPPEQSCVSHMCSML